MSKKYIVVTIVILVIFSLVLINRNNKDRYYKEMSYEILNYEEAPDIIKSKIDERLTPNSNRVIHGSGESFIVLSPASDKSVEVLSVGKDENVVNGVIYKYKYVDKVSDNILDNIKIIKVINFNGTFTGSFISN